MLRIIFIIALFSFACSCNKPTGIKEFVQHSDSIAINFFKGDGSMDTVVKVVILRDAKQVKDLSEFIEAGRTEDAKCGYDGSIHFFKTGMVLKDVDFRMNDVQCMHFSFVMDNKIYSTKLSPEAKMFLTNVMK